jgi:hypothetical protein
MITTANIHAGETPVELRPLSMGQILDQAFSIYRRNFWTFAGLMAVVQIPLALAQFGGVFLASFVREDWLYNSPLPIAWTMLALNYLSTAIYYIAFYILVRGFGYAAIGQAAVAYRLGRQVEIRQVLRSLGSNIRNILITALLSIFILFVIGLLTLVPVVGWLIGPGMGLYINLAVMPLLSIIVMLEGKSGMSALRRAWSLVRRRMAGMLGFAGIIWVMSQLMLGGPSALLYLATIIINNTVFDALSNQAMFAVERGLISVLFYPIPVTAFALMYLDLRARTEGLDLALEAETAPEGMEVIIPDLKSTAPAGLSERLFTRRELLFFAGLTVFVILLVLLLGFGLYMLVLSAGPLLFGGAD